MTRKTLQQQRRGTTSHYVHATRHDWSTGEDVIAAFEHPVDPERWTRDDLKAAIARAATLLPTQTTPWPQGWEWRDGHLTVTVVDDAAPPASPSVELRVRMSAAHALTLAEWQQIQQVRDWRVTVAPQGPRLIPAAKGRRPNLPDIGGLSMGESDEALRKYFKDVPAYQQRLADKATAKAARRSPRQRRTTAPRAVTTRRAR